MTSAPVNLICDNDGRLSEERMEGIGDNNFAAQIPGIMASRRSAAPTAPPSC